jgi:hypothetical protein
MTLIFGRVGNLPPIKSRFNYPHPDFGFSSETFGEKLSLQDECTRENLDGQQTDT